MSEKPSELEIRVAQLEIRLDQYHRDLVESINQRDEAVLWRTWRMWDWAILAASAGVVGALASLLELQGWLGAIIASVGWFALILIIAGVTQRRKAHDKRKFLKLPEWQLPNWVK